MDNLLSYIMCLYCDILVSGKGRADYLYNLQLVLQWLESAGLTLMKV